jgi:hypothetical protein
LSILIVKNGHQPSTKHQQTPMKILTIEDLHAQVPAAFATEPADNVSHRYSFIPSDQIITEVMTRGWQPTSAYQSSRVRDQRHATHMITFRQPNTELRIGDVLPQINLFNNHSAAKRFRLLGGFFRMICSNGLVVSLGIAESDINRIHIDGASVDVDRALTGALDSINSALDQIVQWQQIPLNFVQQNDFAAKAVLIKNNNDPYWSAHFDAREFLNRRRDPDRANDLWTVFNVVQENIMRGGVQGAVRTTKPITQVAEVQRINQSLWQLTTEYGQLHSRS